MPTGNPTTPPPASATTPPPPGAPHATRSERLRNTWNTAWNPGGPLHARWDDLRRARYADWHEMANWVKTVLALAGLCTLVLALAAAGDIVAAVLRHLAPAATEDLWAAVDTPVRSYLDRHTTGLTLTGPAAYALWQAAGLFGLIGGFLHSTVARITHTLWGAATTAMVWTASPADERAVATGITVLAWTLASAAALRGLSLRPVIHTTLQPRIDIHLPPQPAPDGRGNVRPLHR